MFLAVCVLENVFSLALALSHHHHDDDIPALAVALRLLLLLVVAALLLLLQRLLLLLVVLRSIALLLLPLLSLTDSLCVITGRLLRNPCCCSRRRRRRRFCQQGVRDLLLQDVFLGLLGHVHYPKSTAHKLTNRNFFSRFYMYIVCTCMYFNVYVCTVIIFFKSRLKRSVRCVRFFCTYF